MSQGSHQGSEMICERVEARGRLEAIIGSLHPGENLKAALGRVATRLGFKPSRIAKMWARDARAIRVKEMDLLRAAAAKAEAHRTAARLEEAANALVAMVPDCDRTEVDRLRRLARELRDGLRPLGEG